MHFDLALLSHRIFEQRQKLALDYSIDNPATDPASFASQLVDAIAQRPADRPLEQQIENAEVFRAAVYAIWSSGTDWKSVLRRKAAVEEVLHGFDPEATVRDAAVGVSAVASKLGTRFRDRQAAAILKWAHWLAVTPDFYGRVIRPVAQQLREASEPAVVSDGELMLALAALFSEGRSAKTPVVVVPEYLSEVNAAALKLPGMRIPISCEFLRNLRWSGFKPDVHITRLFDHWTLLHGLPLGNSRARAQELVTLVGRPGRADMVSYIEYGLTGLACTPAGTPASEADNLIWLLGSYIEPIGHESDLPYLREDES